MEQREEGEDESYTSTFEYLLLLPDVPETIARSLSIQDLAACCACSRKMREVFSDNSIWEPRCDKELCEYLEVTPCKVEPRFITPKFEQSSLNPIPKWKVECMRQNHLWNNWRLGRSVFEHKQSLDREIIRMPGVQNWGILIHFLFVTNDCVIFIYHDRIQLLDLRDFLQPKPVSHIRVPLDLNDVKVMTRDGMLIIFYHTLVLVYEIDFTKGILLKNVFFINKTTSVDKVEDLKPLIEAARESHGKVIDSVLVEDFLVAICRGESSIHIWDIKSGLKVKTQDCLLNHKQVSLVVSVKVTGLLNLIICVKERSCKFKTLLAYNLPTLEFLPFNATLKGHCDFSTMGKYVAVWTDKILTVYDYESSQTLLTNQPIQSYCHSFRNHFVFLQGNVLKGFLPSSQRVTNLSLSSEPGMSDVMDEVHSFDVLNDKFIQVERYASRSFCVYEVDDALKLKKSSLNRRIRSPSLSLNKTSTRYIDLENMSGFTHLW